MNRRCFDEGIGTSPGIALGKVFVYKEPEITIFKRQIENLNQETERLELAIEKGIIQIEGIYNQALETLGGEKEAEIFNAHRMIMEDPEFVEIVKGKIRSERINAEWAIKEAVDYYIRLFKNMEDEYLKERVLDLKDVSRRLLRILLRIETINLSSLEEECIIVAEDLTPSDTAQMNKDAVIGIVTEIGGKTSHTSIMARALEIPAIAGLKGITNIVKNGDFMIIHGKEGGSYY